jgi:hypothetical protein
MVFSINFWWLNNLKPYEPFTSFVSFVVNYSIDVEKTATYCSRFGNAAYVAWSVPIVSPVSAPFTGSKSGGVLPPPLCG